MSDTQKEMTLNRWQEFWDELVRDPKWVERREQRDRIRPGIREEILNLLRRFLSGEVQPEELRATFDKKTRNEWQSFALKGMNGAMVLNVLVKHSPDPQVLSGMLQQVLPKPADDAEAREKFGVFGRYLQNLRDSAVGKTQQFTQARMPFFCSSWWHMQDMDAWPIYYTSGRKALEADGLFEPTGDVIEDYLSFRHAYRELQNALGLKTWDLELLLRWHGERPIGPIEPDPIIEPPLPPEPSTSHTQIQWLLAKIGRKLGCKVWIAVNDHSKEWKGERLGDMSLDALPSLGLDEEALELIKRIDVLWLKGANQVAGAFEIECTTSVYSGLLRLSDLTALSPNLSFPLYIVVPEKRIEKVRRELSRPTFQTLELNLRCGFFSEEALIQDADHIMKWGSDPSVIENMAEKVGYEGEG